MTREFKELRPAYGFDDVAIVPGDITLNPELVDISTSFDGVKMEIPFLASAMDSVVDTNFAIEMSKAGGLAVMNMDGIHSRYEDPEPIYQEIAETPREAVTVLLQKIYSQPTKPELVGKRVEDIIDFLEMQSIRNQMVGSSRSSTLGSKASALPSSTLLRIP